MINICVKSGQIYSFEDEKTMASFGFTKADFSCTEEEWAKSNKVARLVDGEIVLGEDPEKVAKERDEELRRIRSIRLQETDIYMIEDYPISAEKKEAFKKYRKELRDITKADGYPFVELPKKPE